MYCLVGFCVGILDRSDPVHFSVGFVKRLVLTCPFFAPVANIQVIACWFLYRCFVKIRPCPFMRWFR